MIKFLRRKKRSISIYFYQHDNNNEERYFAIAIYLKWLQLLDYMRNLKFADT